MPRRLLHRARRLARDAITREKLDVATMLQVWPVRTQKPTLPFATWRALVVPSVPGH
jgi:hypothetical protein